MSQDLISFSKIHGAGNDFVIFDARAEKPSDYSQLAIKVCSRHFGIGADGLIAIKESAKADFKMLYYNADGGSTVCGNGMRCVAAYLRENGLFSFSEDLKLEVESRVVSIATSGDCFVVNMGKPIFKGSQVPVKSDQDFILDHKLEIKGQSCQISVASMGNPHAIVLVDDVDTFDVEAVGSVIEKNEFFPERTNVEFVQVITPKNIKLRIWERGVGETLACGTGISAALAVLAKLDKVERKIEAFAPGGSFEVEWREETNDIYLTGPAVKVYHGVFDRTQLLAS